MLKGLVKSLTHDFTQTYTDIKKDIALTKEPLSKYNIDDIKRVIKNARKKEKRDKKELDKLTK